MDDVGKSQICEGVEKTELARDSGVHNRSHVTKVTQVDGTAGEGSDSEQVESDTDVEYWRPIQKAMKSGTSNDHSEEEAENCQKLDLKAAMRSDSLNNHSDNEEDLDKDSEFSDETDENISLGDKNEGPSNNTGQKQEGSSKLNTSGGLKLKLTFKGHGQYGLADKEGQNSSVTDQFEGDTEAATSDDSDQMEGVDEDADEFEDDCKRNTTSRTINDICGNLLQKALSEGWTDGESNPTSPALVKSDYAGEVVAGFNGGVDVDDMARSQKKNGDVPTTKVEPLDETWGNSEYDDEYQEGEEFDPNNVSFSSEALPGETQLDFSMPIEQEVGGKPRFLCNVCGKVFDTKPQLSRHKASVHSARPGMFRCDKCNLSFSRRSWQAHMKEEHAGPKVEDESGLDNMVWIYPNTHPKPTDRKYSIACAVVEPNPILECCFCCRKFHISGLHAHFLHAHPTWRLQYLCSSCGVQFKAIKTLSRHVQRFPSCSEARCKSCGKSFVPVTAMLDHVCDQMNPEHEEQRSLQCRKCGKSYKQKFHLLLHAMRCKKDDILKNECCICSRVFGTLKGLERHLKNHSTQEQESVVSKKKAKSFKCNICDKTFDDRLEKNRHRTQEHRDHVCPVCNEAFETKSKLGRHMVSHRTEKNYTCPLCDTQNRYRSEFCVRKHVRRCHAEQFKEIYGWDITIKNFVCDICDKKCLTRGDLAKHIRSHTNERPYKCKHCDSAFKQNRHLKEHMMYRHKAIYEENFGPIVYKHECDQCDRKFLQSCTLKKHLRAHARQKMLEELKTVQGGTEVARSIEQALGISKKPRKRSRKKAKVEEEVVEDGGGSFDDKGEDTATEPSGKKRKRQNTEKSDKAHNKQELPLDLSLPTGVGGIRPLAGVFVNHSMFPPEYNKPLLIGPQDSPTAQWNTFRDNMALTTSTQHLESVDSGEGLGLGLPGEMMGHGALLPQRLNGIVPPINGLVLAPGSDDEEPSESVLPSEDRLVSINHVSFSSMSSLPVVDTKSTPVEASKEPKKKNKRKAGKQIRIKALEEDDLEGLEDFNDPSLDFSNSNKTDYLDTTKIKPDPDACSTDGLDRGMPDKLAKQSFDLDHHDSLSDDSEEKTADPAKCYMEMLEKCYDSDQFPEQEEENSTKFDTSDLLVKDIKKEPEDESESMTLNTVSEPMVY